MKRTLSLLVGLILWCGGQALAAPLSSDFNTWTQAAGSFIAVPPAGTQAVTFGGLGGGGVGTAATFQAAVNAGGNAFNGIGGVGSMIFQSFDRVTGNAGDTVIFGLNTPNFADPTVTIFAYFLDNGVETLLTNTGGGLTNGGANSFRFTNSNNLLVGFGILDSGAAATSATFSSVAQVPEIDTASATLPLAICFMLLLGVSDYRRRSALAA